MKLTDTECQALQKVVETMERDLAERRKVLDDLDSRGAWDGPHGPHGPSIRRFLSNAVMRAEYYLQGADIVLRTLNIDGEAYGADSALEQLGRVAP